MQSSVEADGLVGAEKALGGDVLARFTGVQLRVQDHVLGSGVVCVTTTHVHWIEQRDVSALHVHVPFARVTLHAISRDTESFGGACIYCQVSSGVPPIVRAAFEYARAQQAASASGEPSAPAAASASNGDAAADADADADADGDDDDDGGEYSDVVLIPAVDSHLVALYEAFNEGVIRNPDAGADEDDGDGDDDDDDDDGSDDDGEGNPAAASSSGTGMSEAQLSAAAASWDRKMLGEIEHLMMEDPHRFDDADDASDDGTPPAKDHHAGK